MSGTTTRTAEGQSVGITAVGVQAPATGLRRALRDSWLISGRDMRQWVREPQMILWGLIFPIVFVLLFAFVFGSGMQVPGDGDYTQFLLPGIFAQTMAFGIGETLAAVQADSAKGVTDRFRAMPMSRAAVVAGRAIAGMVYSTVSLALMVVCGLAIGWRWERGWPAALGALGLLLLLRMAFLWIGIVLGLKATSAEMANGVFGLLYPVTMLSNAFVATDLMPSWLGVIATWNPLSATITATRELFGNPGLETQGILADHALALAVGWPLLITAVTLPLVVRAYGRLSR